MPIGILLVSISITILSCEYKYNNLYDNSDYHFSLLISSCQRTFPPAFAARHVGEPLWFVVSIRPFLYAADRMSVVHLFCRETNTGLTFNNSTAPTHGKYLS